MWELVGICEKWSEFVREWIFVAVSLFDLAEAFSGLRQNGYGNTSTRMLLCPYLWLYLLVLLTPLFSIIPPFLYRKNRMVSMDRFRRGQVLWWILYEYRSVWILSLLTSNPSLSRSVERANGRPDWGTYSGRRSSQLARQLYYHKVFFCKPLWFSQKGKRNRIEGMRSPRLLQSDLKTKTETKWTHICLLRRGFAEAGGQIFFFIFMRLRCRLDQRKSSD